jgi:hypothetical protein
LTTSQEAVDLYQELAALNRDAYLPNLATSLWMFALVRQMSRTEMKEAVAAAHEAESMFAELTALTPAHLKTSSKPFGDYFKHSPNRPLTSGSLWPS